MELNSLHELSTRSELAEFLRVSEATVDRHVKAGDIEAVKFGGTVRFTREGVGRFLAKKTTTEPLAGRTRKRDRAA